MKRKYKVVPRDKWSEVDKYIFARKDGDIGYEWYRGHLLIKYNTNKRWHVYSFITSDSLGIEIGSYQNRAIAREVARERYERLVRMKSKYKQYSLGEFKRKYPSFFADLYTKDDKSYDVYRGHLLIQHSTRRLWYVYSLIALVFPKRTYIGQYLGACFNRREARKLALKSQKKLLHGS